MSSALPEGEDPCVEGCVYCEGGCGECINCHGCECDSDEEPTPVSADGDALEPVTVEITIEATSAVEALRRAQAGVLFAFHPDLSDLDDSMDNVFGGSFED